MARQYPERMERLFTALRSVIVPYIEAHRGEGVEVELAAILGQHVAIVFALVDDPIARQEALTSWIAELPNVVANVRTTIERGGAGLQ